VIASATVTDHAGRGVNGLAAGDFLLYDNHKLQQTHIDVADGSSAPISIVVVVETSSVAAAALAKIKKIGGMVQPMITGDRGEATVIAADNEVKVLQEFTSDTEKISKAFQNLKPAGCIDGRILDGILIGARLLRERPHDTRRIILLISETRDRGSQTKIADAIATVQREDITVYAATYSGYATPFTTKPEDLPPGGGDGNANLLGVFTELGRLGKTNTARALTASTGGAQFSFTRLKSLEKLVAELGEELHTQYILSFSPAQSSEPGFHTIEIKIKDRANLTVRTRPGYWPLSPEL
jgi:VWFA-related protein